MAAITLLLLWLFQFIFFSIIYYERQEAHVNEIGSELLALDYNRPESFNTLSDKAKSQNINVYVFRFDANEIIESNGKYTFPNKVSKVYYYSPYYDYEENSVNSLGWSDERVDEFLRNIEDIKQGGHFEYVEKSPEYSDTDLVVYGGKMTASTSNHYLCIIASISNNNFTATFMRNLLFLASILVLGLSIVLSFVFSHKISDPINRLTQKANQLAKGDFDINFESDSFVEIKELAASFNFAKEEMKRTEQMRRDFIANVSHDLRTPLTMIKAYAEMVRDLSGNNPEKRTKHCQIIIDESNRLSSLVADIQNLSKLQSGTDTFQIKTFDLSELCLTVLHRFGIMQEAQGYKFIDECEEMALCQGDYSKIEQVLYNLIGNAVNYTGEDKTVTVRCKKVDTGFRVEISDTGKGIDPSEIDFVWERYYRANQKKRNIVGSGLGLNIVKKILEGHSAQFGVDSKLGEGTTFWFILPAAPEEEEE